MIESLLKKLERRDRMTQDERNVLANAVARVREFRADEDIVVDGSRPANSTLILEGFACRYKMMGDGRRQITAIHVRGDFVDLHSFPVKQMDHGVAALTDCRVALVPHEKLLHITEHYPHLTRLLWLSTLIDAAMHREWIIGMGRRSAIGRLAHLFCELYLRLELIGLGKDHRFPLPVTQQELGDALGLSIVHTNRVLARMRRMQLATFANDIVTINDWPALAELAEFDPTYLRLSSEPR